MTGRTGNAVFSPANERPASHGTNRLIGSLPAGCAFVLAYISRLQGKCVGGVPCPIGRAREKTPKGAWRRPRVMVRVRHHVWEWRTPDDVTRQSDNCVKSPFWGSRMARCFHILPRLNKWSCG